jgi:G3E family GTPase
MRPLAARPDLPFDIAPFTVLVDPLRLAQGDHGAAEYVYRKQLEEAEQIGVTKLDAAGPQLGQAVLHQLRQRFGPARVLPLATTSGQGVDAWLDSVLSQTSALAAQLEIDYQAYAAAEAALGWLNAHGTVESDTLFSAQNWLAYLLKMLDAALQAAGAPIAHVKAQVSSPDSVCKASLTQSGGPITWDLLETTAGRELRLEFILNARVETTPQVLEGVVRSVVAELTPPPHFTYTFTDLTCISPAAPQPAERIPAP